VPANGRWEATRLWKTTLREKQLWRRKMSKSKYESEYTRILTAYRSRIAADFVQTLNKIRGSNRLERNDKNKIDEIIMNRNDKYRVKKTLKQLIFDLNNRYDESKDSVLEQIIITLDDIAGKL
jgi:hypothetical protein